MSTRDRQTRRDGKRKSSQNNTSVTSEEDPKANNTLANIGRRTSKRHSSEGGQEVEVKKSTPHPQPKRPTTPAKQEILPLTKHTSEKAENDPEKKNTQARTAQRGSKRLNADADWGPKNEKAAMMKPKTPEPQKSASPQQETLRSTNHTPEIAERGLDLKNSSVRTVQKGSKCLDEDANWEPNNAKVAPTKPTTPKPQKSPTVSPQVAKGSTGKVKTSKEFREWLVSLLDSNKICGLFWTNLEKTIFRIPWSASSKHFDPEHHAFFLEYAIFMEKPQEEIDARDLYKWKPQVRAKINQQRDVVQLPEWTTGLEGAPGTFKVFEFRDPSKAMTVDRSLRDRSQSYCGPWSQTLGVKQYDILCGRVKDIPPSCVTVGLILEVYDFWKRREMNNDKLREWIGLFLQGEAPKDILHVVESLQIRRCALESSGGNVNLFEKAMFRYKPVSLTAPTESTQVSPEKGDGSYINLTKESPRAAVSPPITKPGGVTLIKPTVPRAVSPASALPRIEKTSVTTTSQPQAALPKTTANSAPTTNAKGLGYLGPCCEKFGITQLKLLQSDFEPLSKWQLTNALVLEIYYFWQSLRFSSERFVSWMSKLANQELNVKRVTKAITKMERKRHQMVLQRSRGGRPELDVFDKALFPAYRYRTDVKYAQCQFSGCKKFPKQDAGYCSRHWKVVGKEQPSQKTPATASNAPHRRKSRDLGMPFSWQQINRLQKDLVAVTSSAEGTSRLPKVCIICNISLESSSGHLMLDEVVETDTKTDTVRARLQRILGEKPKGSTCLCSMCHSTLCQIEEFYNVIGLFKCQYIQSTALRKPGVGAKAKSVPRTNDQDVIVLGSSPTEQNNGNKRKADHLDALGILDQANPVLKSIKWPTDILRNLSGATADFLAQSHLPKEVRQKSEQKKWGHFVVKLDRLRPDQLPKTMTTQKAKRRKIQPSKPKAPRVLVTKGPTSSYQQSATSSQPIVLGTLACLSSKKPGLLSRRPTSASQRIKNCPNLTRLVKEVRSSDGKRTMRIKSSMHAVSAPNILDLDSNNLFYNDPFLDQMETENTPMNTSLDSMDTGHELTPDTSQDGICISDVRSLLNMQMTDGTLAICIEPEGAMKDDVISENFQSFPGAGDRDILVTGVSSSSTFLPDPMSDISIGPLPGVIEILPQDGQHSQTDLGIQDPPAVLEIIPTTECESHQEANDSWDVTESCSTTGTLNSSEICDTHLSEGINEGLGQNLTSEGQIQICPVEGLDIDSTFTGLREKRVSVAMGENIMSEGLSENVMNEGPGEDFLSEALCQNLTSRGVSENPLIEGLGENHLIEGLNENSTNEGLGENTSERQIVDHPLEGPSDDHSSEKLDKNSRSEGLSETLANEELVENPSSEGLGENPSSKGMSENPTSEGLSESFVIKGLSENPSSERLGQNPTDEELSENPTSERMSDNSTNEGQSENPTSEGLGENPTREGLSDKSEGLGQNLTSEGMSENPTSDGMGENPTSERVTENPSREGLSEHSASGGLNENFTSERMSENLTSNERSENLTSEGLSDNPTNERMSENPTSEGISENPSTEGLSDQSEGPGQNLTSKGLVENPSNEGLSDNPTNEGLIDNTTSEELH